VIEELSVIETTTNLAAEYVYGLSIISERAGMSLYLFVADGHGSTRMLVDGQTFNYDAYGNLIGSYDTLPTTRLYCGEEWDPDLGMYYLRARYLNPNTGRFWTMDTYHGDKQDPPSLHRYLYCSANPVDAADRSGLSGTLTIVSTDDGSVSSSFFNGHSFIIWKKDPTRIIGEPAFYSDQTYGTWGNNPNGLGDGLHMDVELDPWRKLMPPPPTAATRVAHIDDAAEANLMALIQSYYAQGPGGWSHVWNCAGFAADAWKATTGEDYNLRLQVDYLSYGVIMTPARLKAQLSNANKNGYSKPREINPASPSDPVLTLFNEYDY
jgi:RHS repeat-associated protein